MGAGLAAASPGFVQTYAKEFLQVWSCGGLAEAFIPPAPVPFTIGIMKWAKNRALAEAFVDFILSDKGQVWFDRAGFIPAQTEEGERLTKKYGVMDV